MRALKQGMGPACHQPAGIATWWWRGVCACRCPPATGRCGCWDQTIECLLAWRRIWPHMLWLAGRWALPRRTGLRRGRCANAWFGLGVAICPCFPAKPMGECRGRRGVGLLVHVIEKVSNSVTSPDSSPRQPNRSPSVHAIAAIVQFAGQAAAAVSMSQHIARLG